jgi:AcrR family transcriptional regulator
MNSDNRKIILDAAKRRFSHYGYSKTSMGEIAKDCDMSVGNLYRFFKNKEAIAVAGVEANLSEKAEVGENVIHPEQSAYDQLLIYLTTRMRFTHGMICNSPHLYELVELISSRHNEVITKFELRAIKQIGVILGHGLERGEFSTLDASSAAETIYYATTKFNVPLFMNEPIGQLEDKLKKLVDLLYYGMKGQG